MIFKNREALEREINRRVIELETANRNDRRMYELEERVHKLEWRVDALEERMNPSQTPVREEYTTTCNPM